MIGLASCTVLAVLLDGAHALAPQPSAVTRKHFAGGVAAGLVGSFAGVAPARGVVYLDPARYGDQELKNAAIAKCRTRVRDAIVRDPASAPAFFLLARPRRPPKRERGRDRGPRARARRRCSTACRTTSGRGRAAPTARWRRASSCRGARGRSSGTRSTSGRAAIVFDVTST